MKNNQKLTYYADYRILDAERDRAKAYIAYHGFDGNLTPESAEEILNDEYLFLKKLKRLNDKSGGNGIYSEKKSIADDTEFGQVFIHLLDKVTYVNRTNWSIDMIFSIISLGCENIRILNLQSRRQKKWQVN